MKNITILSFLCVYLEIGFCIEESNILPVDANRDGTRQGLHSSITKRNTAFKRLPAWSVYYGKRSSESPSGVHSMDESEIEHEEINTYGDKDLLNGLDSKLDELTFSDLVYYIIQEKLRDSNQGSQHLETAKRANFKRLQSWLSTYGKRNVIEKEFDTEKIITDNTESEADDNDFEVHQGQDLVDNNDFVSDLDLDNGEDYEGLREMDGVDTWVSSQNNPTEFSTDDKRLAGWSATYGKRAPWSVTYGKRAPWSVTYGKRAPWSVTYGKRAPWSVTYGKRAPSWSITYGKRVPWGATYGKRVPWGATYGKRVPWGATYGKRVPWGATYGKRVSWGATYGKRVPWGATYGKRVPWGATYGKRVPWGATYGKRSQGWNAFYGKRTPMSQAMYGKHDGFVRNSEENILDESEDTADVQEKRSQAWSAFYGR